MFTRTTTTDDHAREFVTLTATVPNEAVDQFKIVRGEVWELQSLGIVATPTDDSYTVLALTMPEYLEHGARPLLELLLAAYTDGMGVPGAHGPHAWRFTVYPKVEQTRYTPRANASVKWALAHPAVRATVRGSFGAPTALGRAEVLTENGWMFRDWTWKRPERADRYLNTPMVATIDFAPAVVAGRAAVDACLGYLAQHGPRAPRDPSVRFPLEATAFGETRTLACVEYSGGYAQSVECVFAGTAGPTGQKIYPSQARFQLVEGVWLLAADNWCLNRGGGQKVAWFDKLEKTELRAKRHGKGN